MAVYTQWYETTAGGRPIGTTVKEDLQDWIVNLSPRETPVLSALPQVGVNGTFVEFQTDALRTAAHNAVLDGIAFTEFSLATPSRLYTHVQTFYESGMVDDTERQIAHAGFSDPFLYHQAKAMLQLKNDIELALHCGTAASGSASAARQFNGLLSGLSTNMTSSSGTTLTETIYGDYCENIHQNGAVQPSRVYVNSRLKRTISLFETRNQFVINASEARQYLTTDFYRGDFGEQAIIPSRHQLRSATPTAYGNSIVILDPQYFATGWLQSVKSETLARDGLRDRFQLSCKLTLVIKNELAGGGATGLVANI